MHTSLTVTMIPKTTIHSHYIYLAIIVYEIWLKSNKIMIYQDIINLFFAICSYQYQYWLKFIMNLLTHFLIFATYTAFPAHTHIIMYFDMCLLKTMPFRAKRIGRQGHQRASKDINRHQKKAYVCMYVCMSAHFSSRL